MAPAETAVVSPVIDAVGWIETWVVQSGDWAARNGLNLKLSVIEGDAAVEVSSDRAVGLLRAYRGGAVDASVMRLSDRAVVYDIATPIEGESGFHAVAEAFRAAIEACGAGD